MRGGVTLTINQTSPNNQIRRKDDTDKVHKILLI